jgi:glycosyltransferase involved in cell wall biosynthesis
MIENNILISICMITYNHEKYILDALNGIFKQKFNFNCELIIYDDCSSDNTENIINDHLKLNKNKLLSIIFKKNTSNIGFSRNFYSSLVSCKGKYIAFCEGDDYWTDPFKLDKQINFLEENREYNLCYHDVLILNQQGIFSKDFINKTNKKETTNYDLAVWGNYIHTCSVVVRNNNSLEQFDTEINICDYIIYLQFVNDGKIMKIEETMSVYRYGNGIWSSSSNRKKQKFIIDNINIIKKITKDDTINEIMQLRLNSIALYSLPNYIKKTENLIDGNFNFEVNEKIPTLILISIIRKKIIHNFKKLFFNKL